MTTDEAKAYLRQVEYLDESVSSMLEQIERMDAMSKKCTSALTGMPRSGVGGDFTKIRDRIDEERDRCAKEAQRLLDLKVEARERIESIQSGRSRAVLEMRYLSYMTFEKIAERMDKDVSTINRWHGTALLDFCAVCNQKQAN